MPTYQQYKEQRDRAAAKAAQDRHMAAQHRMFDLSAQDNHMKYERPSFAVVTASDAFRTGYENINWHDKAEEVSDESGDQPGSEP